MTTPARGTPPALGRLLARATQPAARVPVAPAEAQLVESPAAAEDPAPAAPREGRPDAPPRRAPTLRTVQPPPPPHPDSAEPAGGPPSSKSRPRDTRHDPRPQARSVAPYRHAAPDVPAREIAAQPASVETPPITIEQLPDAPRPVPRAPRLAQPTIGDPAPGRGEPAAAQPATAPERPAPPVVIGQITVQVAAPQATSEPFPGCSRLADGVTSNRGGGW
jgi:fused signal recognition particle receptor